MKVTALRGVCISPGQHLLPGDPPADLDDKTAQWLISIGAVLKAPDEPAPEPPNASPAKAGKKES